uniref:Secreted protein n=1 Tax=Noctiluca scintillans TaxID=2966 RepID=A0A7S0ZLN2_NOCSC|mmetsp:Transcript_10077/g.28223  ORF Transcript_10077/g.28223 Transcript_10077/m.28223 type:complete len:133 (+) Transcript_10077:2-400(+)
MTPAWMRVPLMALVPQALATAFQVGLVSRALKRQRAQMTAYHPERNAFTVLACAQRAFSDLLVQTNCAVTIAGVMALAVKAPVHASRAGLGRSATTSWMDCLLVTLRARARDNASMGNASVRKASLAQIVPS